MCAAFVNPATDMSYIVHFVVGRPATLPQKAFVVFVFILA